MQAGPSAAIVNGTVVPWERFKFYVGIRSPAGFGGGAIIGPWYVLTAAHVVINQRVDALEIFMYPAQVVKAKAIFVLPADVALIKLQSEVRRDYIIPLPNRQIPLNQTVAMIGKGKVSGDEAINTPAVSRNLRLAVATRVTSSRPPALQFDSAFDAGMCYGDSGGPIFVNNMLVSINGQMHPDCNPTQMYYTFGPNLFAMRQRILATVTNAMHI